MSTSIVSDITARDKQATTTTADRHCITLPPPPTPPPPPPHRDIPSIYPKALYNYARGPVSHRKARLIPCSRLGCGAPVVSTLASYLPRCQHFVRILCLLFEIPIIMANWLFDLSTIELKDNTVIVVLGASGDLAKKKTVCPPSQPRSGRT